MKDPLLVYVVRFSTIGQLPAGMAFTRKAKS
jgi:hypothetical protein